MVLGPVLVTGASGMVGRALLAALPEGCSGFATSRTRPVSLPPTIQWRAWDLAEWKEPGKLDEMFAGVTAIIHAGAVVPGGGLAPDVRELFDANVRACLCLGRWALERSLPIVYISGSTVYADPERVGIKETDPTTCRTFGGFYGFTKKLAEDVLDNLCGAGLKLTVLRPSSVYGPGLPRGKMITGYLERAGRGETIALFPPVDDRVDLIHADDVASAAIAALDLGAHGLFNLGSGSPISIEEIARACVGVVGRGQVEVVETVANRPPTTRFGLDCAKARTVLSWTPKVTIEAGLRGVWAQLCQSVGKEDQSGSMGNSGTT